MPILVQAFALYSSQRPQLPSDNIVTDNALAYFLSSLQLATGFLSTHLLNKYAWQTNSVVTYRYYAD